MKNEIADRIIGVLRKQMDTDTGTAIIMKMMSGMKESDAETFAEDVEGMAAFSDYLSQKEANMIVSRFENFDGSRGGHWNADTLLNAADAIGIRTELPGHYNDWAFYAVMNMVWGDEWGVLRQYVDPAKEVEVCAKLAEARLTDRDRTIPVRWYFGLD